METTENHNCTAILYNSIGEILDSMDFNFTSSTVEKTSYCFNFLQFY